MDSMLLAYIDPFAGSLMIQIITVGIFSIGATLRYWRRKIFGLPYGNVQDIENEIK